MNASCTGLTQISGGAGGRQGDYGISDQLRVFGFRVGRLKTGTPARLYRDSIDWSKTKPESGDPLFFPFSSRSERRLNAPQVDCYLSYTNERRMKSCRKNLDKSPMFLGVH